MYNNQFGRLDDVFEDGQEVFVGLTMVKRDGQFVVKSQFVKLQGAYTAKKTGTKKDKDVKKTEQFKSLKDLDIEEGGF